MLRSGLAKWNDFGLKFATLALMGFAIHLLFQIGEQSRSCSSSQLVDSLVVFSKSGEVRVCESGPLAGFPWISPLALSERRLHTWRKSLAEADRLLVVWPGPRQPIEIRILEDEPFAFRLGEHGLEIGGALAEDGTQLRRSVIGTWLRGEPGAEDRSLLATEVLVDFLSAVSVGELEIPSLVGIPRREDDWAWGSSLGTWREYCHWPWRLPGHGQICEAFFAKDQWPMEISLWSLRPLLASALWRIYSQLGVVEKRRFLAQLYDHKTDFFSEPPADLSDQEVAKWTVDNVSLWMEWAGMDEGMAVERQKIVNKLGVPPQRTGSILMVDVEDRLQDLPADPPMLRIGAKVSQWQSKWGQFPAGAPRDLPAHLLWVGCKAPTLGEVASMALDTALLVDTCRNSSTLKTAALAGGDLKEFVRQNPEMEYVWLNAGALRKAREHGWLARGLWESSVQLKRLRRQSHWREDVWDSALKAFRPRAALEWVHSHRASRNLM